MKKTNLLRTVLLLVFALSASIVLFSCDGSGGGDSESVASGNGGGSTSPGTAVLRGNISFFDTAKAYYRPASPEERTRAARVVQAFSELLLPSAEAAGNREGIVIYIDGPVSKSTTTASDGSFQFTELSPGTYALRFEYNGEEIRYRGNSGQVATITLEGDTIVEILNMRISGGKVNIGNIKIYDITDDDDNDNDDDGEDEEEDEDDED